MNTSIEHVINEMKELEQNLGVISTTAGNKPEAAVIYFAYDEHLNIYFATRKESRKYKNISANPNAAFVIYNAELLKTIQIEGVVSVVEDPYEQVVHYTQLVELAVKNNPLPPIDQLGESEIMFLKLTPVWARVGNFEMKREGDVFEEVTA
ncbi:MAG TPA: pyridoxamine 5'-phosphate oxidase family protein [Candidatus Paceibacterota bacterium]